jgi:hypothetical protein
MNKADTFGEIVSLDKNLSEAVPENKLFPQLKFLSS